MEDLTMSALCQALANITRNRCSFIEHSNTCRCIDDTINARTSTVVSTAPDVSLSEVFLIFFVLSLWLSAIGFCLHQYKSLRRLETQVHYFGDRKDPLNIGDIKIVAREQDSIIYKKKRYSTTAENQINLKDLKKLKYVKQYLPRLSMDPASGLNALVINREDLTGEIPLSATGTSRNTQLPLAVIAHPTLTTHEEVAEDQSSPVRTTRPSPLVSFFSLESSTTKIANRRAFANRTVAGRLSVGLAVPDIASPNSLHSSWNSSQMYDSSCSAQHLSVPSSSLRLTRFSDGNISTSPPPSMGKTSDNQSDQLIDPRLIPNTVRRSLLALHRESQENIPVSRNKEKTQSENDVHGAFTPWKMKMKSKLKRTYLRQQQKQQNQQNPLNQLENASKGRTLSIFPVRFYSNDQERRASEYATSNTNFRFSSPPLGNFTVTTNPIFRRSLKHFPKYSTQSTTESETATIDQQKIATVCDSIDDERSQSTILSRTDPFSSTNF